MKKFKISVVLMCILLASVFVFSSMNGIITLAANGGSTGVAITDTIEYDNAVSSDVVPTIQGTPNETIDKAYQFEDTDYCKIETFPINNIVFNSNIHFFCIQHNTPYGGQYRANTIGNKPNYHVQHQITSSLVGSGSATTGDADMDDTAAYYVEGENLIDNSEDVKDSWNGFKEDGENPEQYVYTNWYYEEEEIDFSCETNVLTGNASKPVSDGELAFLLACYLSQDVSPEPYHNEYKNNGYQRGVYNADPLQNAVWASVLNTGTASSNPLKTQGDSYMKYHNDSENPNVNVFPMDDAGAILEGVDTIVIGKFKMSDYVRADDINKYPCPKVSVSVNTNNLYEGTTDLDPTDPDYRPPEEIGYDRLTHSDTNQTLQDAFGDDPDLQGTIIKAEAKFKNASGGELILEFDVPEPNEVFELRYTVEQLKNYDILDEIIFTYQRIHAVASGTKYIGTQYKLRFTQESQERGCEKYTCPGHYCGTKHYDSDCHNCTCTTLHVLDCSSSHHSVNCPADCSLNHSHNPYWCYTTHSCSGHTYANGGDCPRDGYCDCDGNHGPDYTNVLDEEAKCKHKHNDCYEFKWKYASNDGEYAQDGFAGAGHLVNEIKIYTVKVEVPLKTNVSIYKYITEVKHKSNNEITYSGVERKGMTSSEKQADFIKVENGDIVTYNIDVENSSRFPVAVVAKDFLPSDILDVSFVEDGFIKYQGASGSWSIPNFIELNAGESKTFKVSLEVDSNSGLYINSVRFLTTNAGHNKSVDDYTTFVKCVEWGDTATNGKHHYGSIINYGKSEDSDTYKVKEFAIAIDKSIRSVQHVTNGEYTFQSDERAEIGDDNKKHDDPVYAEYGDRVTYVIDVHNTDESFFSKLLGYLFDRFGDPFWDPDDIYVDIVDRLPIKHSELDVKINGTYGTYSEQNGTFTITDLYVPAGTHVSIEVSLVVEEVKKGTYCQNEAELTKAVNINKKSLLNKQSKLKSLDWYVIQDYDLEVEKFITKYDDLVTQANNSLGLTAETNQLIERSTMTEDMKKVSPVQVEQTEEVTYTIRLTNRSVASGNYKYATKVRPADVLDAMDPGFLVDSNTAVTAKIYKADGTEKHPNMPFGFTTNNSTTHHITLENKLTNGEYLILEPGEYIVYEIKATVTKSNMYLENLVNTASLYRLTNINADKKHQRIVTEQNLAIDDNKDKSSDYVKLKDLVIAGKVWLDTDRDGYMGLGASGQLEVGGNAIDVTTEPSAETPNDREFAMKGITVKLYNEANPSTPVRTTTTDENGLFTFARATDLGFYPGNYKADIGNVTESLQRVDKATNKDSMCNYNSNSNPIKYYIEYEYDGLVYTSTEIYSYKDNLNDDGTFKNDKYLIDSNAAEIDSIRDDYNKKFEIIGYNQAGNNSGDSMGTRHPLKFDKVDHESHLKISIHKDRLIQARSFIVPGTEDTDYLWLYQYDDSVVEYPETEYLKYINLGLERRDQFDLRLTKDLLSAQVRINGFTLDYDYAQVADSDLYYYGIYKLYLYESDYRYRFEMYENKAVQLEKGMDSELQVDFNYKITVYNESPDYVYGGQTDQGPYAKIYEIIDFNTDTMTLKEAKLADGTLLTIGTTSKYNNETMDYVGGIPASRNISDKYSFSGYEVNYLTGMNGMVLDNKDDKLEIYLTYTIDKEKAGVPGFIPGDMSEANLSIRRLYLGDKNNIAEISAYGAYRDENGTIPEGMVDNDSNAGNVNSEAVGIDNYGDTYEDDTFRVDANIDIKPDEREISGFVYEDTRSDKVDPFNHFTGDGWYDKADGKHTEIEKLLENSGMLPPDKQDLVEDTKLAEMTVQLVEIVTAPDASGNMVHYEETIDPLDYTSKTNVVVRTEGTGEDIKYVIDSFIPGRYLVRFKYGDIYRDGTMSENSLLHNGQDYKSTSYSVKYTDPNDISLEYVLEDTSTVITDEFDYNNAKIDALEQENLSDARDNEFRRIEVMAESEVMTHNVAEFMKHTNYTHGTPDNALRSFSEATNCFADTVTFILGVEDRVDVKRDGSTAGNGAVIPVSAVGNAAATPSLREYVNEFNRYNTMKLTLDNVDFGVTYRPENFIEITKKIKRMTLKDSTGKVIVDVEYDLDGKITSEIGGHNVQAVNTIGTIQGFRYINVDEEILQGASLAMEYYMMVDNIGEVDTVNKFLIEEGGSEKILAKLDANRSVLQSETVLNDPRYKDNYFRVNELIKATYGSDYDQGIFVGDVYYKGLGGDTTDVVVVPLTVSKILDFVDNDASFVQINNIEKNKYWQTTNEDELTEQGLIGYEGLFKYTAPVTNPGTPTGPTGSEPVIPVASPSGEGVQNTNNASTDVYYYKDELNRQYVTSEHNNLVFNVPTELENPELVREIVPRYSFDKSGTTRGIFKTDPLAIGSSERRATQSYIVIQVDAVLGGDTDSKDMVYDNVAEVVEFLTPVGRRTNFATTIGNIEINGTKRPFDAAQVEPDTDGTEIIRLTPPTGITRLGLFVAGSKQIVMITIAVIIILILAYLAKYSLYGKIGKTKFYK